MHLVDVHAHLDHERFADDLPDVIARWKANGVVAVIAQGLNHESNVKTLALAKLDPTIKVAMGLYPCEAAAVRVRDGYVRSTTVSVVDTLRFIQEHAGDIIAIGEVGLDLQESDDLEGQQEVLRAILKLAKALRKPVILHSRKAEKEVLDLLEEEGVTRAVMHCFCGSRKLLERGIAMGLSFSIPTAVVRNQQFRENAALVPMGQLLLETDAPYMGPMKDLRNEPAHIRDAIATVAEIKRMDPVEVANAIYFNYQKLFQ